MSNAFFKNIAIAGDIQGVNILMKYIPKSLIKCILVASNRPQDVNYLEFISFSAKKNLLFHLSKKSDNYNFFLEQFKNENPDLIISSSYSMILEKEILKAVKYNAINFHFSLLPNYRGLNPVQYAIMNNETETGLTVHLMNDNINDGDIIFQEKVQIDFTDTWNIVQKKIISLEENFLQNNLNSIIENNFKTEKLPKSNHEVNKQIGKNQLEIKPSEMTDLQIYNLIRANTEPMKPAFFNNKGKKITYSEFEPFDKIEKFFSKFRTT